MVKEWQCADCICNYIIEWHGAAQTFPVIGQKQRTVLVALNDDALIFVDVMAHLAAVSGDSMGLFGIFERHGSQLLKLNTDDVSVFTAVSGMSKGLELVNAHYRTLFKNYWSVFSFEASFDRLLEYAIFQFLLNDMPDEKLDWTKILDDVNRDCMADNRLHFTCDLRDSNFFDLSTMLFRGLSLEDKYQSVLDQIVQAARQLFL